MGQLTTYGLASFATASAFLAGAIPTWAADYRLEGSVAQYRWVEEFDPSDIEEHGPVFQLGGYVSGFPSTANPELTLRGDFRILLGEVTFDTYVQDVGTGLLTPTTTETSYVGTTQEVSVGLQEATKGGAYVEPFFGLGYRWWRRDISGDAGYVEYYQQIYGRLGIRTEQDLNNNVKLRMSLSVDPQLWAREQIDLSGFAFVDGSSGLRIQGQDVTLQNGLRPGWTAEIGLGFGSVDLTGYWQAVRLGESDGVVCFTSSDATVQVLCNQPESTQDILGLRLGVAF